MSVNLVVSKKSITDHSNQLLMLWLSQLSSVKVDELYFPCINNMNVIFYSFGIRLSLKGISGAFLLC